MKRNTYLYLLLFFCIIFSENVTAQYFIENKGQVLDFNENFHPEVKYYSSANGAFIYFQKDRVIYNFVELEEIDEKLFADNDSLKMEVLKNQKATYYRMDLAFENANPSPSFSEGKQIDGVTHFYLNKRNGIRDVRSFESIRYENIYPRTDIVFHSGSKGMKYDIVLKSGANINDVRLKFEGANLSLRDNQLIIKTEFGEIVEDIPLSFINEDKNSEVEVAYKLVGKNTIGFELKSQIAYNSLTIDPVMEWNTYFNQVANPDSYSASINYLESHLDDDGNYFIYGHGYSAANNYPIVTPGGAYTQVFAGTSDTYLAKFNANRVLVWSTYLGGSGSEENYGYRNITSDGDILHIVGQRISSGAPFTNGGGFYESVANRNYWARFNKNTGVLLHLTSLSNGYYPSIAISPQGKVAIISDNYGGSSTWYMPIMNRAGAYNQAVNGGYKDMGLLLFDSNFNQIWGTFLGGPSSQEGFTCTFDQNENLYFAGHTSWYWGSPTNPSTAANERMVTWAGAYNQQVPGGGGDITMGRFNSNGALIWHTLYGGDGGDGNRGQQGFPPYLDIHPTTNELVMVFNTYSTDLTLVNLPGAYNKGVPTHPDFGQGGSFWQYAGFLTRFSTGGSLKHATYFYTGNGGGNVISSAGFGGCDKYYIGASGNGQILTGAPNGYNMLGINTTSASGFITQFNASSFAFEWDGYLNEDVSSRPKLGVNTNNPRVYAICDLYYNNLATVDPGNGAYYQANNNNFYNGNYSVGLSISQLHPSLPPDVSDVSICEGESATLTASGGMGTPYDWYTSLSASTPVHTGNSYTVSPATSTTYYVSSGTGICASPRTPVTVTISPSTVTVDMLVANTTICEGEDVTIVADVTGTFSGNYQWESSTNGTTWQSEGTTSINEITITNLTQTTHFKVVLDGTSGFCSPDVTPVIITANPNPTVTLTASSLEICAGESVTLTASGASSYTWTGAGTSGTGNTQTVSPTTQTTYTVTGTTNGCEGTVQNVVVDVNPNPTVTLTASSLEICAGESVTLTASGASSYTWTGVGTSGSG
ncbi:MAG: hypothetical protein WC967_15920, partial [Balneolaceae bacterium]